MSKELNKKILEACPSSMQEVIKLLLEKNDILEDTISKLSEVTKGKSTEPKVSSKEEVTKSVK